MAALDFPNSPTNGQQYSAPNGAIYTYDGTAWTVSGVLSTGSAAGGDLSGTYPNPSVVAAVASKWTDTGTTLTPKPAAYANKLTLDNAGNLTAYGQNLTTQAADGNTSYINGFAYGSQTYGGQFIGRLGRGTSAAPAAIQVNDVPCQILATGYYGGAGSFSTQALLKFMAAENWTSTARGILAQIWTTPVGSTSLGSSYFTFDHNGNYVISGTVGQKASGTTWSNPSDPRVKNDVEPYTRGLAEILKLEPIRYTLNGLGGTPAGVEACGFDAEAVRAIFPECVTVTRGKLHPDDEEETDILSLDIHGILIALVNAVKELAARSPDA